MALLNKNITLYFLGFLTILLLAIVLLFRPDPNAPKWIRLQAKHSTTDDSSWPDECKRIFFNLTETKGKSDMV